jgi:hypothetical protein
MPMHLRSPDYLLSQMLTTRCLTLPGCCEHGPHLTSHMCQWTVYAMSGCDKSST